MTPNEVRGYDPRDRYYYCNECDKYYTREHNLSCTVDHRGGCCHLYDEQVGLLPRDVSKAEEVDLDIAASKALSEYQIMIDGEYMKFDSAEDGLVYLQQELQTYQALWKTQKQTITVFQQEIDIMEEKETQAQQEIERLVEENEALIVEKTIDSEKVSTGPKRDWTHAEVEMLKQDFQEDIKNMKYSLNEAGEFIGEILLQIDDMKQNYS